MKSKLFLYIKETGLKIITQYKILTKQKKIEPKSEFI